MIDAALVVLAKSLGRRGRNAKRGVIVIATYRGRVSCATCASQCETRRDSDCNLDNEPIEHHEACRNVDRGMKVIATSSA